MSAFALNQVDVSAPRGFINSITTQCTTQHTDCVLVAFLDENACVHIDKLDLPTNRVEMLESLIHTATENGWEQVIITRLVRICILTHLIGCLVRVILRGWGEII